MRIIIADDHAIIRDGLRAILSTQLDMEVVGDVPDGRQAVQLVEKLQPDIAILDITMPVLNGIDAAEQIKQATNSCKIIILSMHATSEYVLRALQAGAMGYLLKESAGKEVVEAVRSISLGKRYLSQKISETIVDDYLRNLGTGTITSPLDNLSLREREVLQLVVEGYSSAEISQHLNISIKSVDTYRSRLMQKLDIDDIPGLVKFAIQHGLTVLD
jgi:DNA-binding NarL/FixJ family response regulator